MVLYGDEWPLAAAVAGLVRAGWPDAETVVAESPDALSLQLWQHPSAGVLLCLRPHESLPVLDALCPLLHGRVVRVVSPTLWYSDRVVLGYLGYRRGVMAGELEGWLPGKASPDVRGKAHPLGEFMEALKRGEGRKTGRGPGAMSRRRTEILVKEVRSAALRLLPAGVTSRQWFILCQFAQGRKGGEVASLTGLKEKTVSLYRHQALSGLGMEGEKSGMVLYRGVLVQEELQRYPGGDGGGCRCPAVARFLEAAAALSAESDPE
ncbi:hypothetical protein BCA43_22185 [Salmonella enterica]|nr:hypothetical protein [Salmonella enterica]HCM3757610.1 hypothetical protein [Salmonella enterica subsp. enterica serovar London]